jgi:selenocysteine-specific elongation factor
MYVIGTAGHVDHGKSTLVQALTGIDPDRLREEKARGMTIDLGFAWLRLPSGQEVGIVDVPGHERFIKNMLAGVGSIDLALLVIAADEGVMPQTREHLAILDFLDISHGVIAITKCDLVDKDWLDLLEAEVCDLLQGTALATASIIPCSAVTDEGLPDLLAALDNALADMPPKRDIGRPRLAIDRVFTIAGFGTVVTGTLVDGPLAVGQEVELLPGSLRSRIRGLQNHQRKVDVSYPGSRTAVNLIGVEKEQIERGMVLTTLGWLQPTTVVDVSLRASRDAQRPIRHGMEATLHIGASEVAGRLLLLDRNELKPDERGWAQLRLEAPVAVIRGDFFVVRSPNETIGGGRILDAHPRRHRRHHRDTLDMLANLERGAPEELLLMALERQGPCSLTELSRSAEIPLEQACTAVVQLAEEGRLTVLGDGEVSPSTLLHSTVGLSRLTSQAFAELDAYHQRHPLRMGMPKEELRNRIGLSGQVFNEVISFWSKRGQIAESRNAVRLPNYEPRLTTSQQATADAFLRQLAASPCSPPTDGSINADIASYLEEAGQIVRVGEIVFLGSAYAEMTQQIVGHIRQHGTITLAQVRDMFGTSRKYAQALLEHLDEQHITRRVGDERVLRRAEALER